MYRILFSLFSISFCLAAKAQTPRTYTSSEIVQQLKQLKVLGSVLYIAAHPDDENTRLLGYLANEKLYRTGYLSLTRGDGGQNIIGDEQGVDLGLIRTQELLAARRIDGAEQFFSRAFDFGFSKSPEEAMRIWDHDKILSDVVWVIRKFRPDVIITRFPTTGEGGHGHHTASAILAGEAFDAAADPTKFPEQLTQGVEAWQAKRLLWNTFNFGSTNTQNESQLKIDCGDYNPLLGKSYGEIAAEGRSQHKSQGFGVPAQRGSAIEYFKTIKGDIPTVGLMDGVNTGWSRVGVDGIDAAINLIKQEFSVEQPQLSVPALVKLYQRVEAEVTNAYWRKQKLDEVKKLIENCAGLFMEATTNTQYAVKGDSLKINLLLNNRLGANILNADAKMNGTFVIFDQVKQNTNMTKTYTMFIAPNRASTQPYWLDYPKEKGSFNVQNQQYIGLAENEPLYVDFSMMIEGREFIFRKPIRYKYTDPVKGELYQPVDIINPVFISAKPSLLLFNSSQKKTVKPVQFVVQANKDLDDRFSVDKYGDTTMRLAKGEKVTLNANISNTGIPAGAGVTIQPKISGKSLPEQLMAQRQISYDHIPNISYSHVEPVKIINLDLKTEGRTVGYIAGAGDRVPEALEQMGYKVTMLKEADLTVNNLRQFDAVVTGVRAYNTNAWLSNGYPALMQYVKDGGVLLVQYNTNNSIGPVKAKISPYPFTISRNRITDEEAKVNFLLPNHPALNHPNKITEKDFEGWIQERSIYNAEKIDSSYQRILGMKDPGEADQDGSLIIAPYGRGRFVYTGLVFFRELPAGVPGAYRLFANLIANKRK